MQVDIHSTEQLGEILKTVRKSQSVRQDDMADMIGTSHVYVSEVEKGSEGANIGGILKLLDELGVNLILNIPDESEEAVSKLSFRAGE
jgi:transcriptional regulator with XRE-family HTH domain